MAFSAGDHFKSRIAVPAPEAARLCKLVMFRSSNAAFYLRPVVTRALRQQTLLRIAIFTRVRDR
jgi:hypothetical protein